MDILHIQADDRESNSGILSLLQSHPNVMLDIKRMAYGDYLIDNWLIIERKQINDLLVSIIDGRLFQQAEKICQSPYQSLLIIEGQGRDIQNTKMDRRAVLGALACVSLTYGICVLRTKDKTETVNTMFYAAQQKSRTEKKQLGRHGYRPKSFKKRQSFILQGLPDVGPVLAEALLRHFGSVRSVMLATEEQLKEVAGVGNKTAKNITLLLTE
ncbi:MAG: multidrug MFS transporter [Paraglaciecola sp.]|nr:multidrug MFS transporter [Paraglaciecola sp.]